MDDLLNEMNSLASSIKKKKEKEAVLLQTKMKDLQETLKSVSGIDAGDQFCASIANLTQEIKKMKVECDTAKKEKEKIKKDVLGEKDKNAQQMKQLQEKKNTSEKVYPRARYCVNIYRDVSRIKWQTDVNSNEVRGFIHGKSGAKTFKFDSSKQSQFFITNSLWDMDSETTS